MSRDETTALGIEAAEIGLIEECTEEFGPHEDHSDCQRMLDLMNAPYPDETD